MTETERVVLEGLSLLLENATEPLRVKVSRRVNELLMGGPTVESVYGKPLSELKAPAGWRFTGEFRPALDYPEIFMDERGHTCSYSTPPRPPHEQRPPRLILVRCKRLVFDIVDEGRGPKAGELFGGSDWVSHADKDINCRAPYILSEPRVEE